MGKMLIYIGVLLAVIGALYHWYPGLFSWFGRLPGDIRIERDSGSFYFPLVSMLIVSIVATIVLNVLLRK